MTKPSFPTVAAEHAPSQAAPQHGTRRPLWLQGLIVAGAFLSALAVLYAKDLVPALGSAVVFFLFYRRLQPTSHVMAQEPAPSGPDAHEERRSAA